MRYQWTAFVERFRCALLGHLRNRLSLFLVYAFVPTWLTLVRVCGYEGAARLHIATIEVRAVVPAMSVAQVTNAVTAVALITGFMMFMAAFKAREMDRRLVLAGYPRSQLVLANVGALLVIAAVLACYTTVLLRLFFPVHQFGHLLVAVFAAGCAYGGIGLLLGTLVRDELEGFFVVLMLSLIDVGLQNPVIKVAELPGLLKALPSYGATQSALAAAVTRADPGLYPLLALAWCGATVALALLVFHVRTRGYWPAAAASRPAGSRDDTPAVADT